MKTVQILSMLSILVLVSSCGSGTRFPTSDVPYFAPTSWTDGWPELQLRLESGNPDVLLFFHQSFEQRDIDRLDGRIDFEPHDPIYRFNRTTNIVDIVDDSVWDNETSEIDDCYNSSRISPFTKSRTEEPGFIYDLLYTDEKVEVEGGTFLDLFPATFSDSLYTQAVAALSTDGFEGISFFFLFNIEPTGQHFHQLFSEVNGQPLGPPLRLGIGGQYTRGPEVCWVLDNKFVIYAESASGSDRYNKIFVVDVEEEVQSVSGDPIPLLLFNWSQGQ